MRRSSCEPLTDNGVARLEARRHELNLTKPELLARFEKALRDHGIMLTTASAKMRLDRVFNPRMRRPISEPTKMALASALDWSFAEIQEALWGE